MKMNIFEKLHTGRLGQEKCKSRARSTVFWPVIYKDIKKMLGQCSDCLDQRARHCPEPLILHEVPTQACRKLDWTCSSWITWTMFWLLINTPTTRECTRPLTRAANRSYKLWKKALGDSESHTSVPAIMGLATQAPNSSNLLKNGTLSTPHLVQHIHNQRTMKTLKNILGKRGDKQMGLLKYRSTQLDRGYTPSELNLGRRTRCNLPRHGDNTSKAHARNFEKIKKREKEKQIQPWQKRSSITWTT